MYIFFLFFILSGFCSLVYQVVWLRIAMADFGVTSTLISIVLSVFMAGLSFGSWTGGRIASGPGLKSPGYYLRLYGVLEGVIGLSGVISAPLLGYGQAFLAKGAGVAWGSGTYYLATGVMVFVALFPFCTCMGATFPVAMAALKRTCPEKSPRSFSYLYLANLLGAVAGCVGTAFVLIELLGFRGSMYCAVALNFAVSLAALIMSGRLSRVTSSGAHPVAEQAVGAPEPEHDWQLYGVLMTTGITSMALEVVWTRQFTVFLGPVVYSFAMILALFLVANYAGSQIYRRICRKASLLQGNHILALLTAVAGFTAMLTLVTADYRLPFTNSLWGGALRVAAGVVPFGMMVGFITPWVMDRLSAGEPEKAGTAYSLNTIGCILGPLIAGFLLLPLIGERWSILLLGSLFFLQSSLLLIRGEPDTGKDVIHAGKLRVFLVGVSLVSILPASFSSLYENRYPGSLVLRDHTATVIAAGAGWERQLLVNGYGMTELTPITKMMVHLPMAFHGSQPANGLVLCFGMGTSFRSMLSWGVPATVVELVPSIPRLFGYYHSDAERLVADPHARIIIDDARRYLSRTTEHYDVILVDPPPPIEAAASSLLYSVEFYRDVVRRLSPGGVFHQWTDMNEPYLLSAITKSLVKVFPYVRAFNSMEGWGMHYIASMQPLPELSGAELAAKLGPRASSDLVEWGPFRTPTEQFNAVLSHEHGTDELIRPAPDARAIEDDRPMNEYFILRRVFGIQPHG